MAITLSNYHPFDYTKRAYGYVKQDLPARTICDVAKTVAFVALHIILVFPVALILDIVYIPASLIYRCCCRSRPEHTVHWHPPIQPPQAIQPPPPIQPPQAIRPPQAVAQVVRVPQALIHRVLAVPSLPGAVDNNVFSRTALQTAFRHNDPETVTLFRQLIANDGVLEGEGEAPVNIYQWTAGCLLTHYLNLYSRGRLVMCYPARHLDRGPFQPGNDGDRRRLAANGHEENMNLLLNLFCSCPSNLEKAAAMLQIMVPTVKWELSNRSKNLVNEINKMALDMTQDQTFLQQIYRPIAGDIDNI